MTATQTHPDDTRGKRRSIPELGALLGVLVLLFAYFSLTSQYFFGKDNFINILTALAVTGVVCVPGTWLMIAGQVDLSVASSAALSGMVLANVVKAHGGLAGVAAATAMGLLVGLINGFLVTKVGVNSLITTLGTLAVLHGIALLVGNGQTLMMPRFDRLGTAQPLGIPLPVFIFAALALIGIIILRKTTYGRSLYAIGSNPQAARVVGLKSKRILFITFIFSGLGSAFAGMILASQLSAGDPNAAAGLELQVITAIVLGGASLAGGRGTMAGTIIGLLIIGVLNNGLVLINVAPFWQDVARGLLLIIAVSFDQLRQRLNITRR
jgi:ribose transport system permease protein